MGSCDFKKKFLALGMNDFGPRDVCLLYRKLPLCRITGVIVELCFSKLL